VEKDFRVEEARKLSYKAAADFLDVARKSTGLEAAAKEFKLEVKQSDWFSRGEPDKELRILKGEAMNKVMQLTESAPLPDAPLEMGNRYLVCQLLARKDTDENLEKDRPSITKRILQQKQSMVWQTWLKELERQANIRVFKQL
jgi:peptidyl-prolyl cis-trans isomerase D